MGATSHITMASSRLLLKASTVGRYTRNMIVHPPTTCTSKEGRGSLATPSTWDGLPSRSHSLIHSWWGRVL